MADDEFQPRIDQSKLPYSIDKPADASQVVKEFTTLAALVATIVSTSPRLGAQMIEDWTKEPGRSVGLQSLRLSLALESYVGVEGMEMISLMGEYVPKTVSEVVDGLEKAGYLHLHPAAQSARSPEGGTDD